MFKKFLNIKFDVLFLKETCIFFPPIHNMKKSWYNTELKEKCLPRPEKQIS